MAEVPASVKGKGMNGVRRQGWKPLTPSCQNRNANVGQLFVALLLGRAEAVARIVVDPQQRRPPLIVAACSLACHLRACLQASTRGR